MFDHRIQELIKLLPKTKKNKDTQQTVFPKNKKCFQFLYVLLNNNDDNTVNETESLLNY